MGANTGRPVSPDLRECRDCDGPARAAAAFALCQFALHGWAAASSSDPPTVVMHGIALLYDLGLLAGTVWVFQLARRRVTDRWRRTIDLVAAVVVFALGLALACYPLLLSDFLGFPLNVFAVDGSIVGFFVANFIGWSGGMVLVAAATLATLSWRRTIAIPVPRSKWLWRTMVVMCLLGAIPGFTRSPLLPVHPHPLVYSAQETLKDVLLSGERVVPPLARPAVPAAGFARRLGPSPLEAATTFRYDHVFVLVMETVNEADFARGFLGRGDGFYSHVKDRAAYFRRYYTTNLDSYTSLLAMLTSVQVPYRAYARPEYFADVNRAPNLARALRAKGWTSLFVCTCLHQPFVPIRDDWNVVLHGSDIENRQSWAAVGTNAVEAAIEDRAAIPSMISFAKASRRTLVMHELVFGHSSRWTALTGKQQLQYYDEFFQELYDGLDSAGLAETSLLVIVADHGSRVDAAAAENYHVPLLIVGHGVEPAIVDDMFSHLDLQQIVGHYLCALRRPIPRDDVLVVGHSARWVYGQVTSGREQMFLDALDGVVLSQQGHLVPRQIFDRFQRAVASFARYLRLP